MLVSKCLLPKWLKFKQGSGQLYSKASENQGSGQFKLRNLTFPNLLAFPRDFQLDQLDFLQGFKSFQSFRAYSCERVNLTAARGSFYRAKLDAMDASSAFLDRERKSSASKQSLKVNTGQRLFYTIALLFCFPRIFPRIREPSKPSKFNTC